MSTEPAYELGRGAVIEIVEKREPGDHDNPSGDIIVPNEVRINGQALLASADHPVRVHEVTIDHASAVLVTLTLFAKRVSVAYEERHSALGIPVALRIGRSASYEIGTADTLDDVSGLLRHHAEEMDAMRAEATA